MESRSSILVVDDEPDNFEVIDFLLFNEGYNLSYVNSGKEALNNLDILKPDVILLDVMMPGIDGLEVCREIKSDSRWHHIPIIMVTALNAKEDLARCLEAGADDFVGKPISAIELRARIRSMLRIKKQYNELETALASLESVLQLREDMSRMIVHDLRTPITSILMSVELLLRSQLDTKQRQKLERILVATQRLRFLTDDLLIIAKAEAGKMTLNRVEVNLSEMSLAAVSDLNEVLQEKNIEIVSDVPEASQNIWLDANLFRRVFDNLLSNALKFSPSSSQIHLKIDYPEAQGIQGRIRIYDQGSGISEEVKQRIFEKFEIGKFISTVPQTGLGLAFCKMVIEAHGGKIFVEDNSPKGSVFTVEI